MYPWVEASGGPEQYYIRPAWHLQSDVRSAWHLQSDILRSDVPPSSKGIWWPRVVLHQVSLTFTVRCKSVWHLQSDIPSSDVPSLVEASAGQEWYYIQSAWHLQSDIRSAWHVQSDIPSSDVPPLVGYLVVKTGTTSGQLDIWLSFGSCCH